MAKISLKIKGLDELKKKLGKQGQEIVLIEIRDEIEISANKVRNEAIKRVPVDQGYLRNSITVEGRDMLWIVYASAGYAAYQEFGTKSKVEIPAEMQEVASQFKGKKLSEGKFKEAIADWMRRKGIPEEALWPIMAKLMSVGVNPQPFMYPGFRQGTKNLQKDIDNIINRYLNK